MKNSKQTERAGGMAKWAKVLAAQTQGPVFGSPNPPGARWKVGSILEVILQPLYRCGIHVPPPHTHTGTSHSVACIHVRHTKTIIKDYKNKIH